MRLNEKYVKQIYAATKKNIQLELLPELKVDGVHTYFNLLETKDLSYFGLEGQKEEFLEKASFLYNAYNGHLPIEKQTEESDTPIIGFFVAGTNEKTSNLIYLCTDKQLPLSILENITKVLGIASLVQLDKNLFGLLGKKE